jgi:hypothetical protein
MSCRRGNDAQTLGTTAQITHAVEMLRLSSNHDKRLWLARLKQSGCPSDDVCQFKTACVVAYDEHLTALELIESARQVLNNAPNKATTTDASAEALLQAAANAQTAQQQLAQSRRLTKQCAENEAVIRQRYHIH